MGLKPIFSKSFPANNLLDLSLVQDNDPNRPFYKPKYFMFLSMTQGITSENGQRTFDKNSRITIKTDSVKIFAFSNAIKAFARGAGTTLGQFQIFADSAKSNFNNGVGGVMKMAFVSEFEQQTKNGTKKNIAISMKQGSNKPIGVFFSPAEAIAVATVFEFIANKCLELDFDSRNISVGSVQQSPTQNIPQQNVPQQNFDEQSQLGPSQGMQPDPNMGNNPFGDDVPF